jgi:hypothetical protein
MLTRPIRENVMGQRPTAKRNAAKRPARSPYIARPTKNAKSTARTPMNATTSRVTRSVGPKSFSAQPTR